MAEETESTQEEQVEGTPEKKDEPRALSQDDINRLIETARKQEKDKLYQTISTLKDQVTDLSDDRKREREEREKAEEQVRKEAEEKRLAELSAEDRLAVQLKSFEDRLAGEAAERGKLEKQLEREREVAELERFKSELLEDLKEPLEREYVRDVLRGETKQEIEQSIVRAKQKYQDFFQAAVKNAEGEPGRKVTPEFSGKLPGPADGDLEEQDIEQLKGLRGLTRPDMNTGSMKNREDILKRNRGVSEEYVKQKEQLLDQVGALYKKVQGRG